MQRKFISRRSFLKCAGMGAVTAAAAGLLAGCGGSDSSSSSTASSAAAAEPADPNKPYAGVTLYYAATDTEATGPEMQDIVAMVKEMLGPRGPFYLLQKFFGVEDPIIPLLNQKWALPVVVLIAVWKGIGLNFLTYLGALQNVDKSQVEAAEIDGANKWQQIKNVVIPAVAPTTFFLTISSIITSLQNFTVIQSLTDGGPGQATTVMSLNIVNTAFVKYETSYAAAQALVMFAIVMVITLIQWRGQKKWADQ